MNEQEPSPVVNGLRVYFRKLVRVLSTWPVLGWLIYAFRDMRLPKTHGAYFVCNVASWKEDFLRQFFIARGASSVIFVSRIADKHAIRNIFCGHRDAQIVIWGSLSPESLMSYATRKNISVWRLEDGFIRSRGLGAHHIPPASLILDKSGGIYFRSDRPSALEQYLSNHEFTAAERRDARVAIDRIVADNMTKYNLVETGNEYYLDPEASNILIFGQCEDDQSVLFGSPNIKLNTELIQCVLDAYPGSNIFFRPHPDVQAGLRPSLSDVSEYADKITIMDKPFPIWDHIKLFESVCVMTSLAGFEALLRGSEVRTYGQPFYSGWGLTVDMAPCSRRLKKRSIEEVFYAAYIAIPTYFDHETGQERSMDRTLSLLK